MFCQTKDMLIIPFTKVMGAAEKQYLKEILKGVDHQLAITGSWLNSEEAAELFNAHQEEIDEFFESFEESSLYQELHESLNNYDYDSAGELLEKFYRLGAQLGYADIKRDLAYTLADKQALFTLQQYNFGLIKSVNDETLQGIKTTLWDSVASGKGYLETARRLRELPLTPLGVEYVGRDGKKRTRLISVRSRSEMIARTEHARAVNTGTLQAYANYGVESVDIITAGDALVCNICLAYEGNNPHTLEEAQKLLPAHPNFRCCYGAHINLNDIPLKPINNAVSVDLTEDDDSFDKSYDEIFSTLRNELPEEFSDDSIEYMTNTILKRVTSKYEYGQIFSYKTGEIISPEFDGSEIGVLINERKPMNYWNTLSLQEKEYYEKHPDEFSWNYTTNKEFLATQHNHTKKGLYAPSPEDLTDSLLRDWEDYSIVYSRKEVWIIQSDDYINNYQKEQFEKEVYDKIVNPTKEECKKLRDNFKGSKKEKDKYYVDTLNKLYGERLTEHVNNSRYNITIRKVIL